MNGFLHERAYYHHRVVSGSRARSTAEAFVLFSYLKNFSGREVIHRPLTFGDRGRLSYGDSNIRFEKERSVPPAVDQLSLQD